MRTLNVFDITMCVFDSLSSINPERELSSKLTSDIQLSVLVVQMCVLKKNIFPKFRRIWL